jgi:hypothetical protein
MLALRYLALVALTLWVGGLLALGAIAAPSVFDVLAARAVPDSRALAGALVGETLRRFHLVSYICGAALLAALIARRLLGPRPTRFGVRFAIAALMLGAMAYSGTVVSARLARLQAEIGAAPSSLPAEDPRRGAFGRLHATSSALHVVPVLGGLALLFWELKD